ncbi:ATP/ADP translocase [Ordospora colligata]|uniref:ADP,ATP carrier protein n=1 Tax=Ordospora colligata OC4 TaxID=1354746 RepID=A0A0B2UKW0_9MICR|nr:ATP/ADP translocase [Ordospora colligata OC4]KHN69630.1 ATP/ADP translocase [Ordospora colligata OC4]TBU15749.1 ATP/ADP translocase [Ordospora colligata]TBU15877.1 ATP/ADP translocase [Ordospora colligata]TBU18771.1 ATP/ADP translocase [Ordospora colligata]
MSENTSDLTGLLEDEYIERKTQYKQQNVQPGLRRPSQDLVVCIMFGLLFALLSYIDVFLHILGDMVVMKTQIPSSILFIKSVLVVPVSFFFIDVVQRKLKTLGPSRMFEIILLCSSAFLLLFGTVIWPNSKALQIDFFWSRDIFSEGKMNSRRLDFLFPTFLVFNEWISSVLYLISELWGSLIVSFMFFSRLTHQCTESQLKRFFPMLSLISGVAMLSSGLLIRNLNKHRDGLCFDDKETMFSRVFVVASILGLVTTGMSFFTDRFLTKQQSSMKDVAHIDQKMTLSMSLKLMQKSKLLAAMTTIVIMSSVCSGVVEATYRGGITLGAAQASTTIPSYVNRLNALAQIITSIFLLVIFFKPAGQFIDKKGWLPVAIVAPAMVVISLLVFFPIVFVNLRKEEIARFVLENYIGMVVVSLIRISKYCFFDISKEAVSIRIDPMHRQMFRGIHDGLGINVGKTIGSLYCTIVTMIFDVREIRSMALISSVFIAGLCIVWIRSILCINRSYKESIVRNGFADVGAIAH